MKHIFILNLLIVTLLASCQEATTFSNEDSFWNTGEPSDYGLSSETVQSVFNKADEADNFYALLVIVDGQLLVESYFEGRNANSLFHLRSITKNVTSALTGIALQEGHIESLNQPISSFYQDLGETVDPSITIDHMLHMTPGFRWNEQEEVVGFLTHSNGDPVHNLLQRSMSDVPGARFNYNTLAPHVLTDLIERSYGNSIMNFGNEFLFGPLDIELLSWEDDGYGRQWGGTGLQLRARDVAKFGLLYLQGGEWEGTSILSPEWVENSLSRTSEVPGLNTGYSRYWWVADSNDPPVVYGQGFGGQTLMLIPELNAMIIAFQEHLVSFEQHDVQWKFFVEEIYRPIYNELK